MRKWFSKIDQVKLWIFNDHTNIITKHFLRYLEDVNNSKYNHPERKQKVSEKINHNRHRVECRKIRIECKMASKSLKTLQRRDCSRQSDGRRVNEEALVSWFVGMSWVPYDEKCTRCVHNCPSLLLWCSNYIAMMWSLSMQKLVSEVQRYGIQ